MFMSRRATTLVWDLERRSHGDEEAISSNEFKISGLVESCRTDVNAWSRNGTLIASGPYPRLSDIYEGCACILNPSSSELAFSFSVVGSLSRRIRTWDHPGPKIA